MMSKVSLRIEIAGRTYPLTVLEAEKERVEKAAVAINEAINLLKKNYAVNDNQDLVAMSALQLLMKTPSNLPESPSKDFSAISQKLSDLENEVSKWT